MSSGAKMDLRSDGLRSSYRPGRRRISSLRSSRLMRDALVNKRNDILSGRAREKYFRDADFLQRRNIRFWNDAAEHHGNVIHAFIVQQAHKLGAERIMRAGKNREPDDVNIFLYRCGGNHLRRLTQAGIDHLHAGIAQRPRDDLGAAVMSIQPRLRTKNPYLFFWHVGGQVMAISS